MKHAFVRALRWLHRRAWRIAFLTSFCWIGLELHRLNDTNFEAVDYSSDFSSITDKLDDIAKAITDKWIGK